MWRNNTNPLLFPINTGEYETKNKSSIPAINDENIYVAPSLYMYTIESRRTLGIHVIRDYVYSSRTTRFPLPGAWKGADVHVDAGSLVLQKEQLTYTAHSSCKRMVSVVGFKKGGWLLRGARYGLDIHPHVGTGRKGAPLFEKPLH